MPDLEDRTLSSFPRLLTPPRVGKDETLEQVAAAVLDNPGARHVCVVDGDDRLVGVIVIRRLFRTIFFHHADPNLMTRQLMELASSETAGHLMAPPSSPGTPRAWGSSSRR